MNTLSTALPRILELVDQLAAAAQELGRSVTISLMHDHASGWVVIYTDDHGITPEAQRDMLAASAEFDMQPGWVKLPEGPPSVAFQPLASLSELGSPI